MIHYNVPMSIYLSYYLFYLRFLGYLRRYFIYDTL